MLSVISGHAELALQATGAGEAGAERPRRDSHRGPARRRPDATAPGVCPPPGRGTESSRSEQRRVGVARDAPAAHWRGYRAQLGPVARRGARCASIRRRWIRC
jgi:hypothetical protein